MYETYIFDLYGTLVDIHTEEESRKFWKKLCGFYDNRGISYRPKQLKTKYLQLVKEKEEELQQIQTHTHPNKEAYTEIKIEEVFQELFLGKDCDPNEEEIKMTGLFFRTISTEYIRLYPGAIELLTYLKSKGKRILLLSNAQQLFTKPELRELKIEEYFDDIFISSTHGVKKPDSAFFELPYKKFGLNKKNTIMIGNDPIADIKGAKNFGYDTFYLHSNLSPERKDPIDSTYLQDSLDLIQLKEIFSNPPFS